jgi:hypothetical protein
MKVGSLNQPRPVHAAARDIALLVAMPATDQLSAEFLPRFETESIGQKLIRTLAFLMSMHDRYDH